MMDCVVVNVEDHAGGSSTSGLHAQESRSSMDVRGVSEVIEDNDKIAVDHYLLSNALSENLCKLTHL